MFVVLCLGFAALIYSTLRYIEAERRAERLLNRKFHSRSRVVALPIISHEKIDPPDWLQPPVRSLTEIEQQLRNNIQHANITVNRPRQDYLRDKLREIRDILNKTPELHDP